MSLAVLQLNPTVGAIEKNAEKLIEACRNAYDQGARVAVSAELALPGYPPRDLLNYPHFTELLEQAHRELARQLPPDMAVIVGSITKNAQAGGAPFHASALLFRGGVVAACTHKQLLPSYDVFDETRFFEPGLRTAIWALPELGIERAAITICEDAWNDGPVAVGRYERNPISELPEGLELLINLSASPFTLPKRTERPERFGSLAKRLGCPVLFVNQVGGNDELVFDGRSSLYGPQGDVLARCKAFEEEVAVWDLQTPPAESAPDLASDLHAAEQALVLGLRDYAHKCGFKRAVLGLSGGIDSALVATLAADALGPEHVLGIALPSRYSSEGSLADAKALAENLGIEFRVQPIEPFFASYLQHLGPTLDELSEAKAGDTTLENLQARIRGAILMALSNRTGALLLTTGNKSEVAVGYATLYGDMCGGLAVISDVPKTMVWKLSRHLNRQNERIPVSSIKKPPSAELRPDQKDSDSLPDYEVLDGILQLCVEEGRSRGEILAAGYSEKDVDRVLWLLRINEYKRRQAAPGIILTKKAFGVGRRMPIAQGYRLG